jgi:hypothetical protein
MADWRQIQARIRKAKTSSDPPSQLGELYERTRDAMVAFELAQWHEKAGHADETVQWYTAAAQRFRRPQWKTKAEEALTRLGAPIPEPLPEKEHGPDGSAPAASAMESDDKGSVKQAPPSGDQDAEVSGLEEEETGGEETIMKTESGAESGAVGLPTGAPGTAKRRRRGRRGGRKRRGIPGTGPQQAGGDAFQRPKTAAPTSEAPPRIERPAGEPIVVHDRVQDRAAEPTEAPSGMVGSNWQGGASGRSRAGDPGLSSRIAQLESQLRRLLSCPPASPGDPDRAPAGPGVLLLSDSDQVTHYYVEACQTLRIGIGNLLRGARNARGGIQLKPTLAEHLGINEARVSSYLKDHCSVRWIQLDDGAAALAHFATAVLRPVVSE